jgi:hypothetical protein
MQNLFPYATIDRMLAGTALSLECFLRLPDRVMRHFGVLSIGLEDGGCIVYARFAQKQTFRLYCFRNFHSLLSVPPV